ncbi:carbohydrate esterase family 16 protein [Astrocystis sublimbata]|nr:carbohydrate esterase family 16 protein [Astrocystis sublimbata]
MLFQALLLAGLAVGIDAGGYNHGYPTSKKVDNLVVFGDSYSDNGLLIYLLGHGGAPPLGEHAPIYNATGGYTWTHYTSEKLGATTYNYAVGGAVCSNDVTYRYLDLINAPFPSVLDYEIPAFEADIEYARTHPNSTYLRNRTSRNTVYTLWIGTNDLGNSGFLLGKQNAGRTIADYMDCVWATFDAVYRNGGRRFALFTQAPLEKSPLYASPANGGAGDSSLWTNKTAYYPDGDDEYEEKMREYTTVVNELYDYGVPFQLLVQKRWPGAEFVVFDTHRILLDIMAKPEMYLDAPFHATGYYETCKDPMSLDGCYGAEDPLDSFLWWDPLHPSPRADEVIGKEFAKALEGNSSYATYYK